jgi:general nucleoside transport system permease protein
VIEFIEAAIRIATPLMFAALGGILSERAGVFAVGLEGMMLMGAFGGVVGAFATGSAIVGLGLAIVCGAAVGLVVAIVAVAYRADNMVTGLTANILAAGLTSYLMRVLSGSGRSIAIHLTPLPPWPIPGLADIPVVGPLLFALPPLTYLAILGCIALALFLARTQAGLTLRATGESSETVLASGGEPFRVRIASVVACGAVAGIGGAVLSLQQVGTFTDGMTGGRGYLALASLIVARWNPYGAALACLAFGAAEAFELRMQSFGLPVSSYIVQMAPYLIALLVLAALGRASRMPAAIGQPLPRDQ